jgi:hypothetical protein
MAASSFDCGDFSRSLRGALEDVGNQGLRQLAREAQSKVDAVQRAHSTDTVEVIEDALRSALSDLEWQGGDDDFRSWAETIASGGKVIIKPERVRL